MGMGAILLLTIALAAPPGAASAPSSPTTRKISKDELWEIREGRFFQNSRWVFLKTGKLLRGFQQDDAADKTIADIRIMVGRLDYNNFSLNIYPDAFDADADGKIDADRQAACRNIGRILDTCWELGVFCSLSFETYNVGGGGTPKALFDRHPEIVARNALGKPARDVEYFPDGKLIPSTFHPAYLKWSREFLRNFLQGLGRDRLERLLYIETTVEPQYLGGCNYGDRDRRRAFLDFSDAAHAAFERWRGALSATDPARELQWPTDQKQRDALLGHHDFNRFRAEALAGWINGDIEAIRSVAPTVYIAVDFNGRHDDPRSLRLGDPEVFLASLRGVDVIQVAPHSPLPWGPFAWDRVEHVNKRDARHWAVSEHMTATGDWAHDDAEMTAILENTLARGTRWGWEFVNAGNNHQRESFQLYDEDWTGPTLDVIEGSHWDEWLKKIGAPRFVPKSRSARLRAE